MNIVRLLGKKGVISSTIGCILLALAIHYALTPSFIMVQADAHWSSEIQQALKKKIESLSVRTYGISHLKNDLALVYPCLKDILITYSSASRATVYLLGWRPMVIVQSSIPVKKDYVVCEGGRILAKDFFNTTTLHNMPAITIVGDDFEEKRVEPEFVNMALHVHPSIFETYTISWHSKTHICFEDKEKPVTIIADSLSVHDRERYEYVQRIYALEEKYKYGMNADIRLKDSLVCAPVAKQQI